MDGNGGLSLRTLVSRQLEAYHALFRIGMGRRKTTRAEELRGELLTVAEGGSGAVTTRAVAAQGGSLLAAVNELFGGKAGLARALLAESFAELARDLRALQATGDAAADVLELGLAVRSLSA